MPKHFLVLLTSVLFYSFCPTASAAPINATSFRQIFAAALQPAPAEQVNHLIYAPIPGMFDEAAINALHVCQQPVAPVPGETEARNALCRLNSYYRGLSAEQLYQAGVQSPKTLAPEALSGLTQQLQSEDLLIVVVPGIFGEFIEKRAFEEIFPIRGAEGQYSNDSAFAREWRSSLERATHDTIGSTEACLTAAPDNPVCDEQEKLSRLNLEPNHRGQQNVHMENLLNVGSLDDSAGRPQVKVVLFQMDGMTLESISTQERNATIFTRRLEKFFQILGRTPQHIAFVGYSRGTDFALEMLAQAQSQNKPWLSHVSGLVSLGGVVMGSALADDAIKNPASLLNRQLRLVDALRRSLTPLPDMRGSMLTTRNATWLTLNTLAWFKFLSSVAAIQSEAQPTLHAESQGGVPAFDQTLKWLTGLKQNRGGADPAFAIDLLVSEMMNFGLFSEDVLARQQTVLTEAMQALQSGNILPLIQFFSGLLPANPEPNVPNPQTIKYNTDILRFNRLAEAAVQGVSELTTDSRLAWWRTHNVPTSVRYYSVSATMADPSSELVNNKWGYNPGSPDDVGLIKNWQDFQKVAVGGEYAGTALNDSQVAIQKTVFWPQLIASLNPANTGLRSTELAILGTHHWGLALPIVTQVRKLGPDDGPGLLKTNPFPRVALMKALALALTNDIRNDTREVK